MKMSNPLRILAIVLCATLAAFGVTQATRASELGKPIGLRTVMQQLERDMQSVTGAISREDWARVAELVPRISRHPEPPLPEKILILAWLGTAVGKFRDFDTQTHAAADAMDEAAARGDGQAVIAAFADVQQSCLGCHQRFRKSFLEHFYRQR